MAAKGIRIEVGDAAVAAALQRLSEVDLATAHDAIGAALVVSTQQRFERETGPDGKKWQRLRPRTAARRIGSTRRGYENILRVSARLYSSIVHRSDAGSIEVGTNVSYAAAQQLGAEIKREARTQTIYQRYDEKSGDLKGFVKRSRSNFARDVQVGEHTIKIPARPFLGLDDADRKTIADIYGDFLGGVVAGAPA